jgi:DNA invertase Pin-like site-specific DNA recombinase
MKPTSAHARTTSTSTNHTPAVGYLRRSTDGEAQEFSLEDQKAAIIKWAPEHGYHIIRWYEDDAVSGDDTAKRKDFLRMLADARDLADFTAIVCWDRKRFGRFDSLEYGYVVHPLRLQGIYLATVLDGVTDWNDVSGRIVANVQQEGGHQQLLDGAANVARGQLMAASNHSWLGPAPYAYRVVGKKHHKRLVIDDPAVIFALAPVRLCVSSRASHAKQLRQDSGRLCATGGRIKDHRRRPYQGEGGAADIQGVRGGGPLHERHCHEAQRRRVPRPAR